jgi:ABC-type uncharacterized transport system permease subunit
MIRIGLECALVFLLPAALYFGYHYLARDVVDGKTGVPKAFGEIMDGAPLVWLFAAGTVLLFAMLAAFATLQDQSIDKPYEPAIYKDGKITQGGQK